MNMSKADGEFNTAVSSIAPYNMAYPGTWTSHDPDISAQSLHHSVACSDTIPFKSFWSSLP